MESQQETRKGRQILLLRSRPVVRVGTHPLLWHSPDPLRTRGAAPHVMGVNEVSLFKDVNYRVFLLPHTHARNILTN